MAFINLKAKDQMVNQRKIIPLESTIESRNNNNTSLSNSETSDKDSNKSSLK